MYHGRVKEHQSSPPWFWNCRNRSIQTDRTPERRITSQVGAGLTVSKVLVRDKNKKREGIDPSVLTDQWEDIITDDEETKSLLFTLGCYSGEPITVITHLKAGPVVSVKDGRYNFDTELAAAILI